jgi:very-short-patch-repair endonuclease
VLPFNKNLKPLARDLRKNLTDAEKRLWSKIRRKQLKKFQFYRQKNIGDLQSSLENPPYPPLKKGGMERP